MAVVGSEVPLKSCIYKGWSMPVLMRGGQELRF